MTSESARKVTTAPEPSPAPAPPKEVAEPPPDNLTAHAKQLYLLGAEAFAAQRNADAIRYFQQAAKLVPSSKLRYNVALAYDEMGDTGRALREYRSFLAEEPNSQHQADVTARVAELERRLASTGVMQLSVSSEPSGARLRVGGELVGVTPWTGELTPGQHRVQLELPGYRTHGADVALTSQHASDVAVQLAPEPLPQPEQQSAFARIQPLTWSFLGVGVGALAGGLAFELSRSASAERAGNAGTPESAAEHRGAADAKQMASLLLFGVGGAFVVGGSVLLVLDLNRNASAVSTSAADRTTRASLSVPCAPEFCGLLTSGSF
ncbi:MAG TPA: PEGA domain-containing protein [Polyangiaceae bacterium]|nr:PEGA domain-containing protein [Polyangiaceae bacterium]